MEFTREVEAVDLDAVTKICAYIDSEIGIDYDTDETSITIYEITLEEDKELNNWLDVHKLQK